MPQSIKLGFVPSFRFRWSPWTEKMKEQSLAALRSLPGVKVVAPTAAPDGSSIDPALGLTPHGGVNTLDQGEAVADYFAREGVDGLVLCPLDFGDERSACKVAERLRVPTLLYATREPAAVDDPGLSRVSDSYCGNLSISSGLVRRRIPFHFGGIFFPDDPEFRNECDSFARAVAVVKGLRNARFGQVGVRPQTFETVGYDEVAMARKFGQNVIHANLDDLTDEAKRRADDDPMTLDLAASIVASVGRSTVSNEYILRSAKLELAIVDFWEKNRLSAMAMQCWSTIQRSMGISLCALFGRLTGRGLLTACETDILGAASMLICRQAAMGETLPHFIDWTIQHRDDPNRLLAWHCGNAPLALARESDATALRSRRDMTGSLPVNPDDPQAGLFQFQLRPGPVTFCRLAEFDGDWKMLIANGEIIPSDETLAGTWSWVAVPNHARLYRTLVEEGFIHHASMIHGNWSAALLQACRFLDVQPVTVE